MIFFFILVLNIIPIGNREYFRLIFYSLYIANKSFLADFPEQYIRERKNFYFFVKNRMDEQDYCK